MKAAVDALIQKAIDENKPEDITLGKQARSFDSTTKTVGVNAVALDKDGKVLLRLTDIRLDAKEPYDAGVDSVTVKASDITQYQTAVYNSTTGNFIVYVQAVASNGDSAKTTLSVDGAKAYQAGWIKGYNDAAAQFEPSTSTTTTYRIYGPRTTSTYDSKLRGYYNAYLSGHSYSESSADKSDEQLYRYKSSVDSYTPVSGDVYFNYNKSHHEAGTVKYGQFYTI